MNLGSIIANKFRIDRVIGRGAMGVVLEATDMTLGRRVAVKLILPYHAADPQLRGRFIREAHAMTRLASEHVPRVLEVGELEDGMLFLAMEYLEGQSLEQLVQSGGALPAADAVDLVLEALDAIAEAHELGFVHRDLKPSNLFLAARKGKPPILKVLDFGIVKDTAAQAKLTATGTLPGTPAYMAPEQIELAEDLIDARADIWSLGITLHEILTGALPFTGPVNVMLARIRSEAPPRLRATRPDVAPELEAVVARCLSKHPAERFANGAELAAALRELRGRGLVQSERGAGRTAAATEINAQRRDRRETAQTAAESAPTRGRFLPVAMFVITLCLVVGFVLALQGRLSPTAAVPPAQPTTSMSAPLAPSSVAPEQVPSAPLPPVALSGSPPHLASARRNAKHVRIVSARNSGDAAWRGWVERHRQRIEGCAANQACPALVSLHLVRTDGKVASQVQATPGSAEGACTVHPTLVECVTELAKEATPPPDVCPELAECQADVLIAFD